jgi:hypothetical protein
VAFKIALVNKVATSIRIARRRHSAAAAADGAASTATAAEAVYLE